MKENMGKKSLFKGTHEQWSDLRYVLAVTYQYAHAHTHISLAGLQIGWEVPLKAVHTQPGLGGYYYNSWISLAWGILASLSALIPSTCYSGKMGPL